MTTRIKRFAAVPLAALLCLALAGCPASKNLSFGDCHLKLTLTPIAGKIMRGQAHVTCSVSPVTHVISMQLFYRPPGIPQFSLVPGGLSTGSSTNLPPVTVNTFGPCRDGYRYLVKAQIAATFTSGPPASGAPQLTHTTAKGDCFFHH